MNTNAILLIVLLLVVVAGGAYYLSSANMEPVQVTVNNGDNNTDSAAMRAEDNAIVVNEQQPGNTAKASLAYLAAPGFVVIHADNNGQPGAILGASALLQAGENTNITIPLSRASKDGETLHAMLHTDTDANSVFSAASDLPVQSILGGPIHGWFEISTSASTDTPISI